MWARGGQGRGLCQHHDLGAAGGGHVDCSGIGSPTWLAFVGMVQAARDEFAKAPLSPFLLHGLPNPHQVELPPDAPPTPSHGGAPRIDPGEPVVAHPTSSGFPHGSVADLQWRLIKAGYPVGPAGADGFAGSLTRAALAAFQRAHGLYPAPWPKVWQALDAATAA